VIGIRIKGKARVRAIRRARTRQERTRTRMVRVEIKARTRTIRERRRRIAGGGSRQGNALLRAGAGMSMMKRRRVLQRLHVHRKLTRMTINPCLLHQASNGQSGFRAIIMISGCQGLATLLWHVSCFSVLFNF
jgi:hypothetical protein